VRPKMSSHRVLRDRLHRRQGPRPRRIVPRVFLQAVLSRPLSGAIPLCAFAQRTCLCAAVPQLTDALRTLGHDVLGLARLVRGGPPAPLSERASVSRPQPAARLLSAPAYFIRCPSVHRSLGGVGTFDRGAPDGGRGGPRGDQTQARVSACANASLRHAPAWVGAFSFLRQASWSRPTPPYARRLARIVRLGSAPRGSDRLDDKQQRAIEVLAGSGNLIDKRRVASKMATSSLRFPRRQARDGRPRTRNGRLASEQRVLRGRRSVDS